MRGFCAGPTVHMWTKTKHVLFHLLICDWLDLYAEIQIFFETVANLSLEHICTLYTTIDCEIVYIQQNVQNE